MKKLSKKSIKNRRETRFETIRSVRDGYLKYQPCRVCGDVVSEAHHKDYSKPLEVMWLCKKHHMVIHGKKMTNASYKKWRKNRPIFLKIRTHNYKRFGYWKGKVSIGSRRFEFKDTKENKLWKKIKKLLSEYL